MNEVVQLFQMEDFVVFIFLQACKFYKFYMTFYLCDYNYICMSIIYILGSCFFLPEVNLLTRVINFPLIPWELYHLCKYFEEPISHILLTEIAWRGIWYDQVCFVWEGSPCLPKFQFVSFYHSVVQPAIQQSVFTKQLLERFRQFTKVYKL